MTEQATSVPVDPTESGSESESDLTPLSIEGRIARTDTHLVDWRTESVRRREAWDSMYYWKFGYPVLVGFSVAIGSFWPEKCLRLVLIMMIAQPVTMFVQGFWAGDRMSFSLLPIGLLLFALLALPGFAGAKFGTKIGAKLKRRG